MRMGSAIVQIPCKSSCRSPALYSCQLRCLFGGVTNSQLAMINPMIKLESCIACNLRRTGQHIQFTPATLPASVCRLEIVVDAAPKGLSPLNELDSILPRQFKLGSYY